MGTTKGRWVSGILSNLLQYAILPELKLPPIDIDDFEMLTPSDLEDIATQTRRYWGLGDGPIKTSLNYLKITVSLSQIFMPEIGLMHFHFGLIPGQSSFLIKIARLFG